MTVHKGRTTAGIELAPEFGAGRCGSMASTAQSTTSASPDELVALIEEWDDEFQAIYR